MVSQPRPQYYAPAPTPIKHTGFAVASLVLGIIAVVMSGTLISSFIGFVLGILAIIFGGIAYWGTAKDKYGLAGFICGLVAIIIFIIWIIISLYPFRYYY